MGFGSGGGFTPSPNVVPGSTQTGTDKDTDVHEFTGSVDITGSLLINGVQITQNGGGGGGGSPGGADTQVQFNDAGSFGGSANFTFDGNAITVSDDADVASTLGKAKIGYMGTGLEDDAAFAHRDKANVNNYALLQRDDGTTIVNATSGKDISFRFNGGDTAMVIAGSANNNIGINTGSPQARLHVSANTNEKDVFRADGDINNILYVTGSGQVGIGTGTPDTTLQVLSTSTQAKLSYDGSNHATFTVNSNGDMTIAPTRDLILDPAGGDVFFERAGNRLRVEMSTGTCFLQNEVNNGNLGFKINTENGSIVEMARFEAAGDGSFLMDTSVPIQFRDTATAINSPSANNLQITAPTASVSNEFILEAPTAPASAGAAGTAGQIAWDTNYIYICVATNTWKRVAISTW